MCIKFSPEEFGTCFAPVKVDLQLNQSTTDTTWIPHCFMTSLKLRFWKHRNKLRLEFRVKVGIGRHLHQLSAWKNPSLELPTAWQIELLPLSMHMQHLPSPRDFTWKPSKLFQLDCWEGDFHTDFYGAIEGFPF